MIKANAVRHLKTAFRIYPIAVDPKDDNILIPPVDQHIYRHIIDPGTVHVILSAQLFRFKADQIRTCHKHVADLSRRYFLYINHKRLMFRQGIGNCI